MYDRRKPRSVLAVGAHPDDVEIGCAGTLVQHRAVGDQVTVLVMSGGELGAQVKEGRREEALRAAEVLDTRIVLGPFFDGTIPLTSETVDVVEGLIREHDVDTVYVHSPEDAHQDHVVTARAVLAATRKMNRVLFYQSPSTTVFHPTIFVDIEEHLARKMEALKCHQSQLRGSSTLDLDVLTATARYWGSRGRLEYAEAFEPYRFAWDITPPDRRKRL